MELNIWAMWIIVSVWLFFSTFLFYVMIVHVLKVRSSLEREGRKLHWLAVVLIVPWLIIGAVSNTLLNIIVMTVICLDPPYLHKGEFFTTGRLQRYRKGHEGLIKWRPLVKWRHAVANFLCPHVLNPFDSNHC